MSKRSLLRFLALFTLLAPASASPPGWWSPDWWADGNPPVINGAPANNLGPANIGQAKWMVSEALRALDTAAPAIATQVRADLAGTPPDHADRIIDLSIPEPKDAVWIEKQEAPLLIGQLKAISAPFYTRLHAVNATWLTDERSATGTNHPDSIFPWTTETTDDANQAIATIGQLKAVFSLRFESLPLPFTDEDGDRMDDNWELANELDPTDPDDADYDYDEDSISNLYEYLLGSDPWNDSTNGTPDVDFDRDGDGMSDYSEALVGEWTWNSALERDVFVRRLDWEINDANEDPDADGLGNYAELLAGTDPFNPDSDGDGMPDGWEAINGFNPKDSADASEDSDSDGLTNGEEQQFGTAPKNPDADGDGMIDSLEIAAGTDSENQDSDGDGIPDSIDSQPLVSSLAFTDADGDGIPDSADPAPNDPRGTAPSISSETASGNPVSNLIKDETVTFVLTVSNPSGPAPTASNLTFFLNGTEDTAQTTSITAFGSPVGSSQRFLLTWLAKTTANYPALTLQNLTLRFQDAQQATSSIKLARIDVAEWEGMIAGIPEHGVGLSTEAWVANVASHLNGRLISPFEFAGSGRVSVARYRGPRVVKLLDADGRTEKGAATIPQGVRYPLVFITRNSNPLTYTASRIVDISSPEVIPARCIGYLNNSSIEVNMTIAGRVMKITPGELKFHLLPDRDTGIIEIVGTAIVKGETEEFFDRAWFVDFFSSSRVLSLSLIENRSPPDEEWPSIPSSSSFFLQVENSITPQSAGSLEHPGLPQPRGYLEETAPLHMAAEQWHKIVLKVGKDAEAVSSGIGLWLRHGANGDGDPQEDLVLKIQNASGGLEDLSVPPDGKISLIPSLLPNDPVSQRYQQLLSPAGLTLYLKRSATVTNAHTLSLELLKKHEWQPQESVRLAKIDLLPVDLISDLNNDGQITAADNVLKDAALASGATDDIKDKGTEFIFRNDTLSNGIWDKDDTDLAKPADADDDDAEPILINISSLPDQTQVWLEHPASAGLKYYRDRKCTQEIPFSSSQRHVVGGSVAWPTDNKLFIRAEDDGALTYPPDNPQFEGDLVLKIKVGTNGQEIEAVKMKLTVVKQLGAKKYFHTVRDYIFENNTKTFTQNKSYSGGATKYRIVAMREESTVMFGLDTYDHTADRPRLKGIDEVKANYTSDVIINGNQSFHTNIGGYPFPGGMTNRCDGRLCVARNILRPPSDDSHNPDLGGPLGKYVGYTGGEPQIINGQVNVPSEYTFATGQIPEANPATPDHGMGGLTATYSRPELQITENQAIGRGPAIDQGKGVIFTATNYVGLPGRAIELAADARNSGVKPLTGGDGSMWELLFLDGSDSVGLVQTNPQGDQKTVIKGGKHAPSGLDAFYYINTYLLFECKKPRN